KDRRRRLERDAREDVLSVRDAPLDTARSIGARADSARLREERVVVLASGEVGSLETRADLESLRRGKREHRFRQVGLEAIENRHPQARRNASRDELDDTADRVAAPTHFPNTLLHAAGGFGVGASDEALVDVLASDAGRIDLRVDIMDAPDPGDDLDAFSLAQESRGDRAGCDPPDRLARARSAAAAPIAPAVLRVVRVIGVRRAIEILHLVVR